jgi:hypothetical protein
LIKLWLSALALSGFRFAAIQLSFAAKGYFVSEGESKRLDLPFFIEFNLTSGFLVR